MSDLPHERAHAYLQLSRASLTLNERAALDEHLQSCAECRAYADDLARLQAASESVLHRRQDAEPVLQPAPRILPRLKESNLLQRALGYVIGLGALAALIGLLQAFFTAQLQPAALQAPTVTEPYLAGATVTPSMPTAVAATPLGAFPTPTLPSGRDFYQARRLTSTATGAFRPAVSPDGQRVAYASARDDNWDIYVIDLSTNAEMRLTDDPLNDMAPAWSPDGSRIAYQHNVPSSDGPVFVDRMVMSADGSNKTVVSDGAYWLKNEAPQWSPAGDRIAFADSDGIVIASVIDQREMQRLAAPENQGVYAPAWFDDQHVLFVGNGQLMLGDLASGAVRQVLGLSGSVNFGMAAKPKIVYVGQNGATQVGETQLDGTQPLTWASFPPGSVDHAALSPDGKFVAVQADSGLYVVTSGLPDSWHGQPLFRLDQNVPPSDLLSVSWLPDSSGFVYVSLADGKPELHLAQLNMPAIDYLKSLPSSTATPAPAPNPADTSAVRSIAASFWLEPASATDGAARFSFGATITATSQISVYAHIVAFALRPAEQTAGCTSRAIPVDRPFWANQAEFAPGQFVYSQGFAYANDVPDADRLVIRINLIEPGVNGRLLFCTQQDYPLMAAPQTPLTATPFSTPTSDETFTPPTPFPTPQAGLTIRGYVQLADGKGLANVRIYRAFASYSGEVVATTDPDGYYQSDFQMIPGDEMVRVWAELPGYAFGPADTTVAWAQGSYYWRHYYGSEDTKLNFIAQLAP